jgi:hypothetical protein
MEFSQLKTQIMAMFMMQGSEIRPKEYNHIWALVYVIFTITATEQLVRFGPQIWKWLIFIMGCSASSQTTDKTTNLLENISDMPAATYSVSLVRKYIDSEKQSMPPNEMVEKVDAVIEHLSNLDSTLRVRLDGRYIIDKDCDLQVTPTLRAAIKHGRLPNGSPCLEILLHSNELRVSAIRAWIDQIHEEYIYEKSNRLGHKTYYFNEIAIEPPRDTTFLRDEKTDPTEIRYRFDNANPNLHFTMNEFHTSKSFSNVYGSHVDELHERLQIFIDNPEWYVERGIPHTLGILLHGIPGAGKTSTIKAIANDTGRHIFNLSLRAYTTCKQLTNLFYNETVTVVGSDGTEHIYRIPLNKRIYVIEDIDCLTDVVLDRAASTTGTTASTKIAPHNESLTLSFLLNLLDGVLETPGRILVITSNYPERIDKALIRPGRIDVKVEFRRADRQFILDMMSHFYDIEMNLEQIPEELNDIFTPAEVMESLCMYFKNPDGALKALVARAGLSKGTRLEDLIGTEEDSPCKYGAALRCEDTMPAPTPSEVIAEYASCPWTEFRLKAAIKADFQPKTGLSLELVSQVPKENRLLEAILKSGDEVNPATLIQFVEGDQEEEKLEIVRGALSTFAANTANSRQKISHEIIENPDAANFGDIEELVSCNEAIESFHLAEETEEHFKKLFAALSDPLHSNIEDIYKQANFSNKNYIEKGQEISPEDSDLLNRILNEMNGTTAETKSESSEDWIHPSDESE